MATINYLARGKSERQNLSIRLRNGRKNNIYLKTDIILTPYNWNFKTDKPNNKQAEGKNLKTLLVKLESFILTKLEEAESNYTLITQDWLIKQVKDFQGKPSSKEEAKANQLLVYLDRYINYIQTDHIKDDGTRGVSENTVKKFITLKNKLIKYLTIKKSKHVQLHQVDANFIKAFDKHLRDVEKHNENTTGTQITKLKTVLRKAREEGKEVSKDIDYIKVPHSKVLFTTLSTKELDTIYNTDMPNDHLNNAKDWLLIGCYIGQRGSDLLKLSVDNIKPYNDNLNKIELTQQKTNKKVEIPIYLEIERVLQKRKGHFPRQISVVKFNKYIKEVCKITGIDQQIQGDKSIKDPKSNKTRKIRGVYPKYELITSHICRRSFATNYYGMMKTPLIMGITGHTKESTFLKYIGKESNDRLAETAKEFTRISKENAEKRKNHNPHLKVV